MLMSMQFRKNLLKTHCKNYRFTSESCLCQNEKDKYKKEEEEERKFFFFYEPPVKLHIQIRR